MSINAITDEILNSESMLENSKCFKLALKCQMQFEKDLLPIIEENE